MSNIPEDLSFQILEHIQNKADIEMDLYQKSLNMNSEESVHAMLHVPYYETEEFKCKIQDIMQSQREIKARVQEIEFNFEVERQSRVESEKKAMEVANRRKNIDRIRFWTSLIATLIGSIAAVGSLVATIVLR
ncbi:hypothetical protein C814_00828 [Anaerotruncus sp. G3(2012)]|uniref:hypothetical protein n=1 Tax=Anaerotruncus sp. G3(2012) TaxID=1235835 RepID=UPI0003350C5E|nr:hypothetical protein [Anaerotruncus sp. G3(2012)]EOS63354.1 hypothetical protein C814_00828 [Anaerotruncus sp. G3(2012)]